MATKSKTKYGETLWAYWKPKGVVNAKHSKSFHSWLKNNAPGTDIATFIHDSIHDKKHAKAVSELIK